MSSQFKGACRGTGTALTFPVPGSHLSPAPFPARLGAAFSGAVGAWGQEAKGCGNLSCPGVHLLPGFPTPPGKHRPGPSNIPFLGLPQVRQLRLTPNKTLSPGSFLKDAKCRWFGCSLQKSGTNAPIVMPWSSYLEQRLGKIKKINVGIY